MKLGLVVACVLLGAGGCSDEVAVERTVPTLTASPWNTDGSDPPSSEQDSAVSGPRSPAAVGGPSAPPAADTAGSVAAASGPSAPPAADTAPGPTDTDRARFVAAYHPDGAVDVDAVAAELDGDGVLELLFAYSAGGRVQVAVAQWRDGSYEIVAEQEGTKASRLEDLLVADLNRDGTTEVVTRQASASTASMTVWQVTEPAGLEPLRPVGGCWDRAAAFGIVGAELVDVDGDGQMEIRATCDESPLPVAVWRAETYAWRDGAYRPVGTAADGA